MEISYKLKDLVEKITNKTIIFRDDVYVYQTTENIFIKYPGNDVNYLMLHEMCHWLVASEEERIGDNLGYGFENDFGFENNLELGAMDYEQNKKLFRSERSAGYLQNLIVERFSVFKTLMVNIGVNHFQYFEYIKCAGLWDMMPTDEFVKEEQEWASKKADKHFLEFLEKVEDLTSISC